MPKPKSSAALKSVHAIDTIEQMLADLIDGDKKHENIVIAYVVERLREARARAEQLNAQATTMDKQVVAMRNQVTQLQGAINSYADDIREWLRRVAAEAEARLPGPPDPPPGPPGHKVG